MMNVTHSGNTLSIDGKQFVMPYLIQDAFVAGALAVVLLDPDANLGKASQYRNLVGVAQDGRTVWEAELPTDRRSDVYWRIVTRSPLVASSFSSYDCEIDPVTGRLVKSTFYK